MTINPRSTACDRCGHSGAHHHGDTGPCAYRAAFGTCPCPAWTVPVPRTGGTMIPDIPDIPDGNASDYVVHTMCAKGTPAALCVEVLELRREVRELREACARYADAEASRRMVGVAS